MFGVFIEAHASKDNCFYVSLPSLWEALGKPALKEVKVKLLEDIPTLDGYFTLEFLNFIATQHQFKKLNSGNV